MPGIVSIIVVKRTANVSVLDDVDIELTAEHDVKVFIGPAPPDGDVREYQSWQTKSYSSQANPDIPK